MSTPMTRTKLPAATPFAQVLTSPMAPVSQGLPGQEMDIKRMLGQPEESAASSGVKRAAPQEPAPKKAGKIAKVGEDVPDDVSKEDIERMLKEADDVHVEDLTENSLKRLVAQLERKIRKNQEERIKFADQPEKYLKSEVDLDEEAKKVTNITTHPELYPNFVELGGLPLLIGLLNHSNIDISVDVFEVLMEVTDPEIVGEVDDPEAFVRAVLDAQFAEMSVDLLLRIPEDQDDEMKDAIANCLHCIEHLAEISPQETCMKIAKTPKWLPWLIKRVRAQGNIDYNRMFASEILGIVLQNSPNARETMIKHEGVDKLMRGIAPYRKKEPTDSEEAEYVSNMFDCLCSLMLIKEHQVILGKAQGLELMIRMMREQKFVAPLALRLVDHGLRHCPANCQIFVEKLGLKTLFPMFMKKGMSLKKKELKDAEEHIMSIIQSLCRYCTGTAVARVLNKFTENSFEKLERLLELHEEYTRSVGEADARRLSGELKQIDREMEVNEEEQLFLDRCDAGLFTLQQVDLILVRCMNMGNREVSQSILKLFDTKGVDPKEIRKIVTEYLENLDDSAKDEREQLKEYLKTLGK